MNRSLSFGVLISALLLFYSVSFSQNKKIADSLTVVLENKTLTKKERSKLLNALAYYHPDSGAALFAAKQALHIAVDIDAPILEGEALEEIGNIERRLGNNSASLQASFRALRIYETLDLPKRQAACYGQLASNSISDEDYPSAISYLKKAQSIYQDSDEVKNKIIIMVNLGEAYRLAGQLNSAEACFKETLRQSTLTQNEIIKAYSLGNLGMVYSAQEKLDLAKTHLDAAIEMLLALGDPYSTSIYIAELGKISKKEGNLVLAEEKFIEAFTIAHKNSLKEQIRDFSTLLSNFYETIGNYDKALEFQKRFQAYQDSLVNKENIQKIEQLKSSYQIEKRESKISWLQTINTNQKYMMIILGVGAFLLLLFAYLLYRFNSKLKTSNTLLYAQKEVIEKRDQEKALLLRELNHRTKNNLQMISSLLNLQSRELNGHPAQEAITSGKHRVEALSLVHKKLYQEGLDTRIMIKEYIEELVLGLFQGYGATFTPKFRIANISIPVDIAIPLSLIINELITNSLKYAYKSIEDPSLDISVKQSANNKLQLKIRDNGKGFSNDKEGKKDSLGIRLIYSLVEQLDGTIKKINRKGTQWEMSIKTA